MDDFVAAFNNPPKISSFIPSPFDEIKEWNSPKYGGFFVQVEMNGKLLDRVECRKCKKRIGMNSRRLIREHYNSHYAESLRPCPAAFSAGVSEARAPFVDQSAIGGQFLATSNDLLGPSADQTQREGGAYFDEGGHQRRLESFYSNHSGYGAGAAPSTHLFTTMKCERDLLLINAVRCHPELYDPGNAHYRNSIRKALLWEQIAHECGLNDGTIASRRWRSMRDYYIRLMRTSNNGNVKYTYASELAFLLEFVDPSNIASGENDPRTSVEELASDEHLKQNAEHKQPIGQQQKANDNYDEIAQNQLLKSVQPKQQQKHLTVPIWENGGELDDRGIGIGTAQQQGQKQAASPALFAASSARGDTGAIGPSAHLSAGRETIVAPQQQQASASVFAPAGPSTAGEEDDAELFGRRVANFLRSLNNGRRKRRACIGFERMMMEFEAEEEEEQKQESVRRSPSHHFDPESCPYHTPLLK